MSVGYEMEQLRSMFIVNGNPQPLIEALSIADLVEQLGLAGKRIAVERNGDVVPKTQHSVMPVRAGDRFEIVVAVGGG